MVAKGLQQMSDTLPAQFMQFALRTTGAERGMAVNKELEVIAVNNLSESDINAPEFTGFENIRQALESGEAPHITNNMVLDPAKAPTTNTNFANLRLVVVFPLGDWGLVYIDRHVRKGVISKETALSLMQVANKLLAAGETSASDKEMQAIYERL